MILSALNASSRALITFRAGILASPDDIYLNSLAASLPSKTSRNPSFYSLVLFLIALWAHNNKPDSSRDLAVFIMSFIA